MNLMDSHDIRKMNTNNKLQVFQQNKCVFWQISVIGWISVFLVTQHFRDKVSHYRMQKIYYCWQTYQSYFETVLFFFFFLYLLLMWEKGGEETGALVMSYTLLLVILLP